MRLVLKNSDFSDFSTLLHEAIHAANSTTVTDARYSEFGGSDINLGDQIAAATKVDPTVAKSLGEYIITNFPITAC